MCVLIWDDRTSKQVPKLPPAILLKCAVSWQLHPVSISSRDTCQLSDGCGWDRHATHDAVALQPQKGACVRWDACLPKPTWEISYMGDVQVMGLSGACCTRTTRRRTPSSRAPTCRSASPSGAAQRSGPLYYVP